MGCDRGTDNLLWCIRAVFIDLPFPFRSLSPAQHEIIFSQHAFVVYPIVTQAELVKSQGVLKRALEGYAAQAGQSDIPSVKQLQKNLDVRIIPATTILELTYVNENAEQAAKILNAVAEAAVAENTEAIRQEAS